MSEGLFTIKHFGPETGKAHIMRVCCDLCSNEHLVDTTKVQWLEQAMDRIVDTHVCQKKPKEAPEVKPRRFRTRLFGEVVHQLTNRLRFRSRPEEEE